MKAAVHYQYGPPKVVQVKNVPKPIPKENELLVRVKAATVNRTDCALLKASPNITRLFLGLTKPRKIISGTDFAGIIEEVGSKVTKFKNGDKVFGFNDMILQSHAEYMAIGENETISLIPEKASFEEATALMEGFHYARNMLNKVKVSTGKKALVNGATGAIGSALAQLLRYNNIEFYATCRQEHSELIKSLGATKTIDFTQEDFTGIDEKFDYVFDTVGKSSFKSCRSILKPRGVYISSELGKNSENLYYSLFTPLFYKQKVKFPFPANPKASLQLALKMYEQAKYKPVIEKTYKFDDIVEGFKHADSGEKIGNIVIRF